MVNTDMSTPTVYPFVAIVGQEKLKKSLILNVINPALSEVLIRGEKRTAKSTAGRALADLLPEIDVVEANPFQSDPADPKTMAPDVRARFEAGETLPVRRRKVRVVELPISATEDRVVGTLDLETALKEGRKKIDPGLLASAKLKDAVAAAIKRCPQVQASDAILFSIAERSLQLGVDGHRSDIVILKAAKALAA